MARHSGPAVQTPAQPETVLDPRQFLLVLSRRRWVILATLVLALGVVGYRVLRERKVYAASASLIIESTAPKFLDNQVSEVNDPAAGSYWATKEYYETQYKIIVSRAVSARVVEKLGLARDAKFLGLPPGADLEQAAKGADPVAILQGKIRVAPIKDSRIALVTVEDGDPDRAALLANEVAEAYITENVALRLRTAENAVNWLEDRLKSLEQTSRETDLAVYDFKKTADVLSLSLQDRENMVSQKLAKYNDALSNVRTRMATQKAVVDSVRQAQGDPEKLGAVLSSVNEAGELTKLREQYLLSTHECAELRERYLAQHPNLVACESKIASRLKAYRGALEALAYAAETSLKQSRAEEKNLLKLVEDAKAEAFEVNKKQIEFERIQREASNNQRLYDAVLKRLKDIELSSLLRTSNARVLDQARPLYTPVRPDVPRTLWIGALMGLLGGMALAFALEFLDNTVASQSDIEQRLNVAFLGLVPTISPEKLAAGGPDLVVFREPKSAIAECCRAIRTNLLFMTPDKPFRTLLVTSANPQEGKSSTVINLGITMAQSGSRVLLVDTDMRRPRLHKAFKVSNEVGISSVVVGERTLDDAIKSTEVPNLFVLPCGPIPPNPSEMLHTRAFRELLEQVQGKFDKVVLDSPPVGVVADAAVLASGADASLLVLKAARTPREMARKAVRALSDVNAKLLGAILNDVDLENPKYGEVYYAYYRYGYYYADKKDEVAS
jgi:succinoglycan biosynthesis transport protein ExoP